MSGVSVEFRRIVKSSVFLNPRRGFERVSLPIEVRFDPLTGRECMLVDFRFRPPEKADLSDVIEETAKGCPFCPGNAEKATPMFTEEIAPEGRIRVGEALVVPNIMPYAEYSAITIMTRRHFVEISGFTEETLVDAFTASQTYLKRIAEHDVNQKYHFINWNYMPPSGGSIIHPHLQVLSYDTPLGYYGERLRASERYYEEHGGVFWNDLVERERELGERYIGGDGGVHWMTAFTPRSYFFEVTAVFHGKPSILSLSREDFKRFSRGLRMVLRYMGDQNIYSFNLSIQSGPPGTEHFWVNASIIPRFTFPPVSTADAASLRMLNDTLFCYRKPEEVCRELKEYFNDKNKQPNG